MTKPQTHVLLSLSPNQGNSKMAVGAFAACRLKDFKQKQAGLQNSKWVDALKKTETQIIVSASEDITVHLSI